jgi:sortase B
MNKIGKKIAVAASCLAIAAGIVLMAAGQAQTESAQNPTVKYAAAAVSEQPGSDERAIDWDKLPDSVIAWVSIPGTSVDCPVVLNKPDEPGFYLTHDAEGAYSAWGTPYVAAGCVEGLESALVMVYGHHMSDGSMFADLASFSDEAFARDHGKIVLHTREHTYELAPKVVNVVNASKEEVRLDFADTEDLAAYIADQTAEAEVVLGGIEPGQQVFAFCTCSYETSNSRTIVYATEVD